jgi:hypothetical protein
LVFARRSVTGQPITEATTEDTKGFDIAVGKLEEKPGSDYHVKWVNHDALWGTRFRVKYGQEEPLAWHVQQA